VRTIKLTLAYDGTDFHGWQWQPDRPTIQAEMMRALEAVIGGKEIEVSGRTDAGVHALAQVASFRTTAAIPCENLVKALNANLPAAIRVLAAEEAAADFHARFGARAKTYRYVIHRGAVCPPHRYRFVHHFPYPLDEDAMRAAAACFVGTHDFTSFTTAGEPSGERTIFASDLTREGEELIYTVRGSGFLHHMVRNMVGTMLEVGKGNLTPPDIPRILAARDRRAAGPTAPAKGLWLMSVEY
jgi:tRNA pseudouridine38-40 synthase